MKHRVLLVDDEPSLRQAYGQWLMDAGLHVDEASTGSEALRLVRATDFDLVLSDVSMPDIDGLELLRCMRAQAPDLPVVLMLERPNNRTVIQAKELGAFESLIKQLDERLLRETASFVLRRFRSKANEVAPFRGRHGETLAATSFTASEAKGEFGKLLETAMQGGAVVITKHDTPKAVLISVQNFNDLSRAREVRLDTLSREFDALLARMQTPKARLGMKRAFSASPKQLGKAAVAATRTSG